MDRAKNSSHYRCACFSEVVPSITTLASTHFFCINYVLDIVQGVIICLILPKNKPAQKDYETYPKLHSPQYLHCAFFPIFSQALDAYQTIHALSGQPDIGVSCLLLLRTFPSQKQVFFFLVSEHHTRPTYPYIHPTYLLKLWQIRPCENRWGYCMGPRPRKSSQVELYRSLPTRSPGLLFQCV